MYGTGENVRDWLHVSDHCEAIDLILHKGRVGEVYNIGGHNERTNLEVVKTILKALGQAGEPDQVTSRTVPGHDRRYAIDPTKIETELGWKPKYNVRHRHRADDSDGIWTTRTGGSTSLSGEYSNYFEKMYGDRLIMKSIGDRRRRVSWAMMW